MPVKGQQRCSNKSQTLALDLASLLQLPLTTPMNVPKSVGIAGLQPTTADTPHLRYSDGVAGACRARAMSSSTRLGTCAGDSHSGRLMPLPPLKPVLPSTAARHAAGMPWAPYSAPIMPPTMAAVTEETLL